MTPAAAAALTSPDSLLADLLGFLLLMCLCAVFEFPKFAAGTNAISTLLAELTTSKGEQGRVPWGAARCAQTSSQPLIIPPFYPWPRPCRRHHHHRRRRLCGGGGAGGPGRQDESHQVRGGGQPRGAAAPATSNPNLYSVLWMVV